MNKKAVTIYCGSSSAAPQKFLDAAYQAGALLARQETTLITGGGRTGLMGAAATGALEAGGEVMGIIPEFMVELRWHHSGLSELRTVQSMHQRKALMAELSHGVMALPGGIGTFDELTEIITWRQLGLYGGNVVICNIDDYFRPYLDLLQHALKAGFMRPEHLQIFSVADTAEEAVKAALAPLHPVKFTPKFR